MSCLAGSPLPEGSTNSLGLPLLDAFLRQPGLEAHLLCLIGQVLGNAAAVLLPRGLCNKNWSQQVQGQLYGGRFLVGNLQPQCCPDSNRQAGQSCWYIRKRAVACCVTQPKLPWRTSPPSASRCRTGMQLLQQQDKLLCVAMLCENDRMVQRWSVQRRWLSGAQLGSRAEPPLVVRDQS